MTSRVPRAYGPGLSDSDAARASLSALARVAHFAANASVGDQIRGSSQRLVPRATGRRWHDAAMTEAQPVDERYELIVTLLEKNVRTELQVTNAALDLGLNDDAIDSLMRGVSSGLLYAFALDWSPDWVTPGQVQAPGRSHYRC
jgi:hypothetical protein